MTSTMAIQVRYFGTTKVKLGDKLRHLNAQLDKNGELELDIGGLREKICGLFHLPDGADITLTYIDEDGDVVTLVDDDDLREAMRQNLKSFRIDVLMNDDNDRRGKYSSSRESKIMEAVNVTCDVDVGMSAPPYPEFFEPSDLAANSKETNKAASSSSLPPSRNDDTRRNAFNKDPFEDFIHPYSPTVAYFDGNQSEATVGIMCHMGFRCSVCGCDPIVGSRFKYRVIEDYNLCRICFAISRGNVAGYIRIDHPVSSKGIV